MGRRSTLLVLLAVAAAGALLWTSLPGWGASAPECLSAAEAGSEPALRTLGSSARLQGRGRSSTGDPADGGPNDPCPFDAESIVLRVRLLGYEPGGRRPVAAWLRNVPSNPVWFTTRDGVREAWFDVTALFSRAEVRWVGIHAGHRDYLSEERLFWLPDSPPASRVLETSLRMRRARAVLGRVVDEAGDTVASAAVALYRLDGESGTDPCDIVATDADGRFRLRTVDRGPHLALATTHDDAWPGVVGCFRDEDPVRLPGTYRLEVEQEVTTLPRDLVLRAPVAIEGRLTIRGRPYSSSCGYVWARLTTSAAGTRLWDQDYARWLWDGEDARPRWTISRSRGGAFRARGLAAGPYELKFGGGSGTVTDPDLADVPPILLDAPASDVAIDLDALLVEVRLRDEEGPVQDARVEVLRDDKDVHRIRDPARKAWCYLRPGLTYVLRVRAPGHEDTEVEQTLPLGTDAFTWDVHVPWAVVARPVRTGCVAAQVRTGGRGLRGLGVTLVSAEAGRRWCRADEQGRVVFEDVAPGWWEIRVSGFDAGDLAEADHSPYLLPAARPVFVSPGVCTEIDVDLGVGGLLEIAVRDAMGRCVPADAEVLDAGGRVVCDCFLARELRAYQMWCLCEGALMPGTPSVTRQALPPGRYEVRVRPEGAPPRRAFAEVHPGRTTSVEIDLVPSEPAD